MPIYNKSTPYDLTILLLHIAPEMWQKTSTSFILYTPKDVDENSNLPQKISSQKV